MKNGRKMRGEQGKGKGRIWRTRLQKGVLDWHRDEMRVRDGYGLACFSMAKLASVVECVRGTASFNRLLIGSPA